MCRPLKSPPFSWRLVTHCLVLDRCSWYSAICKAQQCFHALGPSADMHSLSVSFPSRNSGNKFQAVSSMYQPEFQRWRTLDAEAVVHNLALGREQLEVAATENRTVECHPGDALACGICCSKSWSTCHGRARKSVDLPSS